jgi:ABC-2 type transport system permease protein
MLWLLVGAAVSTVVVGTATTLAFKCSGAACAAATTGADPAKLSLAGTYLGQAVIAVVAVMVIGSEYGTGMIRTTLAAIPGRFTLLGAKAVLAAGCALAAGLAAVLGSFLAGRLILPARGMTAANGYALLSLGNGPDLRAAAGTVLYFALIALLALGFTTAVRDSAVGVGLTLSVLYLLPIIAVVLPDHVLARHLEQASPMIAGLYIQSTVGAGGLPLTPWQGLAVTAAWAAGALLLGAALLRFRDA